MLVALQFVPQSIRYRFARIFINHNEYSLFTREKDERNVAHKDTAERDLTDVGLPEMLIVRAFVRRITNVEKH